jgi:prepilin-type N-terminal cleavage/methylation domain-containing protein
MSKNGEGFTLIELMVVIVIIGILAAVAVPNYIKIVNQAKVAEVKSNMHSVQVEVEYYHINLNGNYPSSVTDISDQLSPAMKNPFTPAGPVVQDEGGADVAGVVEYATEAPNDYYTITGLGKGAVLIDLALYPGLGE